MSNGTVVETQIDPEFLGKREEEWLAELVSDYINETVANPDIVTEFAFKVAIEYTIYE